MMFVAPVVLLASLAAGGGDPPRSDLDLLQGSWQLTAMEVEGHEAEPDDVRNLTARYEANRVTLRDGDRVRRRGLVTLDPERSPRAINTWDLDGPYTDQTVPGIYELKGDTLRLAFARPGEERPTQFTTKSGTAYLVCVYQRKAK